MKNRGMKTMMMLLCAAFFTLYSSLFVSCSEQEDVEADEYANWRARNDSFFATLEDSLAYARGEWKKIKTFTLPHEATTVNTNYIYIKVLDEGSGTEAPMFTDTVSVSYLGRLIPTTLHPDGYVFDRTYIGTYSPQTTALATGVSSAFVDGFATALQYMHRGDRWRVYIPYQLGYKATPKSDIPAYSTLIFDLALEDFWHPGKK